VWDLLEVARHAFAAAVGTENLNHLPSRRSGLKDEGLECLFDL
jgi:hypothetical protein